MSNRIDSGAPRSRPWSCLGPFKGFITPRFELCARFPLRPFFALRHPVSDLKEQSQILDGAGQIPIRLHIVRDLVVIALGVLLALLHAVAFGLPDEISPVIG